MSQEAVELIRAAFGGAWSNRRRPTGTPFDHLWAYVVEVRQNRVASFRAYYDPAEALEAVGLRE